MTFLTLAISILLLGPLLVLLLDSLFRGLFLLVAPRRGQPSPEPPAAPPLRFAAVIPAHNEEALIGATVERLREQLPPGSLFVIADNCTDSTAKLARQGGAVVYERHDPQHASKGAALKWFLQQAGALMASYEAIGLFDADSMVDDSFVDNVCAAMSVGSGVVQARVYAHKPSSWAASLADFSEALSANVDDAARNRLGWPIPLRGFGMIFDRELIADVLPKLQTRAEDVEMSLLLTATNHPARLAVDAIVAHQAESSRGVATQRARWQQGAREVWRYHGNLILRLLLSGSPGKVSLVFATLVKPKTVVLAIKGLLFVLFLFLPLQPAWLHWSFAAVAGLAVLLDLLYYLLGLCFVDEPGRYARALLHAPAYLLMWLWSLALSFISRKAWLSARHD